MDIKVLGTGCCATGKASAELMERIEQAARARGVPVTLTRVDELRDIMGYGVMSMPGVVIDGRVVHAGGTPSPEQIAQWLSA